MSAIKIVSDGDPYPALAGNPLTNTAARLFPGTTNTFSDQSYNFTFTYRGGTNSLNPFPVGAGSIGIALNGVIIKGPVSNASTLADIPVALPTGFQWDTVTNQSAFFADGCSGFPDSSGRYTYQSGLFLSNGWMGNATLYGCYAYFNSTAFGVDRFRHADGHSKILGFMFDGYPIYGPYGYTNALISSGGTRQMLSSYRKKGTPQTGRVYTYAQYATGTFIQDYEYVPNEGTLDEYNGRYCLTPDFPLGTYAYFLTFETGNLNTPAYPYIAGTSTREQRPVGGT
jgi:hypothetical protein